ncbi:CRISPR-associated endonuclease Cas3'' [Wohlfahrtiimonas larvae]|uniref:CRISPR-associated endonuclease Cas3 n=1 Tax=Wohlfahrtiimonas larvae TaxID=1157986 RepID=A0ABP9MFD1_9GAMM|nr:CRISPR-associated endonuclease Cas3'' [Wohlfahrtiimonas larvae]
MMVTFVSQCEKKSLAKTRRVLDAYANRIGDNVWQTIITEEGLLMVKKLLRRTASKNTAVSCHWIRSRRRSDLLWIVGNRNKFNSEGIVPVNVTQKELLTDVITMKAKQDQLYANTHLQLLAEHLFAVGYLSERLFKNTVNNEEKNNLANIAYLAGCLHDIGKIDPNFQNWVRNDKRKDTGEDGQHIDVKKEFSFENYPRHNEISAMLLNFFEDQLKSLNIIQKEALNHIVYWHHAKPFRKKDDFDNIFKAYEYFRKQITEEEWQNFTTQILVVLESVNHLADQYGETNILNSKLLWEMKNVNEHLENFEYSAKGKSFAEFKSYSELDSFDKLRNKIDKNAYNNLLRACIISADRIVSSKSSEDLSEYIQSGRLLEWIENVTEEQSLLNVHLEAASTVFPMSERTQLQNNVALQLSQKKSIPVLAGPAGCGKTRIALEWARLQKAEKIIWVCPRVQVCQGIFEELTKEYLPDADIEIFTGEFKYTNEWGKETDEKDCFSGDVVVTTIDQILGSIVTHTNVDGLLPFMNAHVVFDEYHEYLPMEIFNLLFAELIANKNMHADYQKKALLVSATPHYYYLENILGLKQDDVVEMASFNHSNYQIQFIDYDYGSIVNNPFYKKYDNQTFIISNTALTAQLGFIYQRENENSIVFHAKFKKSDKKELFNEVYDAFKKEGTQKYDVLRSGPIVQASLNISADAMLTEMTSPENMLQRLGRLDRFGKNSAVNILSVAITEHVKNGKQLGAGKFLNTLNSLQTTKSWYDYLQNELGNNTFQLTQLYELYRKFYDSEIGKISAQQDLEKAIKQSIHLIGNKVSEPRVIVKTQKQEQKSKISRHSLRGDSRFVQLAKLDLEDYTNPIFLNEYAYHPPVDDISDYDNLTESLSIIRDSGLVDHLAAKHGRIDPSHPMKGIPATKMTLRKQMLEGGSCNAEYPLYLSYIQDDLDKINEPRHNHAVYYAICNQQAIGMIAIDKLEVFKNNL